MTTRTIDERDLREIQMRISGQSYGAIAKALGGSMEAVRSRVLITARRIAGEPGHPLYMQAIELIRKREPDYTPSETDGMSRRAQKIVKHFGNLQGIAAAGTKTALRVKWCGRRTIAEITSRLHAYGLEWSEKSDIDPTPTS